MIAFHETVRSWGSHWWKDLPLDTFTILWHCWPMLRGGRAYLEEGVTVGVSLWSLPLLPPFPTAWPKVKNGLCHTLSLPGSEIQGCKPGEHGLNTLQLQSQEIFTSPRQVGGRATKTPHTKPRKHIMKIDKRQNKQKIKIGVCEEEKWVRKLLVLFYC